MSLNNVLKETTTHATVEWFSDCDSKLLEKHFILKIKVIVDAECKFIPFSLFVTLRGCRMKKKNSIKIKN